MKSKLVIANFFLGMFAFSINVYADVDVNNFEFKGYKFGIKAPARSNLPPWEMSFEEFKNYVIVRPYKRIKEYRETRSESLKFGDSKLFSIRYQYFDDRLYSIEVDFVKQSDCRHARDANELIQLKYELKTDTSAKAKLDDYMSSFSNGKISISVNCSMPILDSISNSETTEKQTVLVFEDAVVAKRVQDYIKHEDDASFIKSQKFKEDKLRQKIDF